jgi:cystathionine beta-lyase/cystathionine gamma-synthase
VSEYKPETRLARGQLPAVDRATIHAYEDATPGPVYYQRSAHPVGLDAERVLGELDGGHALLFPSGSGATIALLLALLGPGATVAVAEGGYWGTVALLEGELARWGLNIEAFDQTGEPPNADLVWLEPCANPMMSFPDLNTAIAQAHAAGAVVVVDNTVLSPVLLRPLEYGADFVLHSASKILAGHHDALLGVVTCARAEDHARLAAFRGASGIVAAPDPAWLLARGLKTLALRVERQSHTALELARRLVSHPAVLRVRYPARIRWRHSTSTRSGRCCRSTSRMPRPPSRSSARCS